MTTSPFFFIGAQCFIDALVREAENGSEACEEPLSDILRKEVQSVDQFHSEVAKLNELICNIAKSGSVFKQDSLLHNACMQIDENDQRIVWTNDHSGESGKMIT